MDGRLREERVARFDDPIRAHRREYPSTLRRIKVYGCNIVVAHLVTDRRFGRRRLERLARVYARYQALVGLFELIHVLRIVQKIREIREEAQAVIEGVRVDLRIRRCRIAFEIGREGVPMRAAAVGWVELSEATDIAAEDASNSRAWPCGPPLILAISCGNVLKYVMLTAPAVEKSP